MLTHEVYIDGDLAGKVFINDNGTVEFDEEIYEKLETKSAVLGAEKYNKLKSKMGL